MFAKCGRLIQQKFIALTKPSTKSPLPGAVMDLTKSKPALLAENALLRQQLLVLNRQVKHPKFNPNDRFLLVILASLVCNWKQALLILKPDTLLGWHRQGFNDKALNCSGSSNLNLKAVNPELTPKLLP